MVALVGGASAFFLHRKPLEKSLKPFIAGGALVLGTLVASSAVAISTPPPAVDGPVNFVPLPFPIPAGTVFELRSPGSPGALVNIGVPAKGIEPAVISGAWNSTDTICLYLATVVSSVIFGLSQGSAYGPCGTEVAFHYRLTSATWIVQFYVPLENRRASNVTIRITQTVRVLF